MENPEMQFYVPGSEVQKTEEPKKDTVSDKELNRSIIVSVISILVCMTCLFGLTWAWFSPSVKSGSDKITAANFALDIVVKNGEEVIEKDEEGFYNLTPEVVYSVSLAKKGTAKTGFCHLAVTAKGAESATAYYTKPIPLVNPETKEESLTYIFKVIGASKIKFTPMWGKCPEEHAEKMVEYDTTLELGGLTAVNAPAKTVNEEKAEEKPQTAEFETQKTDDSQQKQPEAQQDNNQTPSETSESSETEEKEP